MVGGKIVFYDASLCQVCSYVEALITCEEACQVQSTETILCDACGHPGEEIGVFYMSFYERVILYSSWITQPVRYIHRSKAYMYVLSKEGWYISTKQSSKTKYVCIYTHWIDFVKAQPVASRTPVSVPMFRGEYAAGPLLCFSPQSLSYLEVHCCHKAESREKHCRAWRSSITGAQTPTVVTTAIEVNATKEPAITNIWY